MPVLPQSPKTAQAAAGAATLNCDAGLVTTEALVTAAAGGVYTLVVGCNHVTSKSLVFPHLYYGTNSQGDPDLVSVTPSDNGTITFKVINRHATQALNGSLKIGFVVFN